MTTLSADVVALLDLIADLPYGDRQALVKALRPARKAGVAMDGAGFWSAYREAQAAIIAEHGLMWKVRAQHDTVLAVLPAKYRSWKTERGTVLRYSADQRLPCARFWAGGELPEGLEIVAPARKTFEPQVVWFEPRSPRIGVWMYAMAADTLAAHQDQIAADRAARAARAAAELAEAA